MLISYKTRQTDMLIRLMVSQKNSKTVYEKTEAVCRDCW